MADEDAAGVEDLLLNLANYRVQLQQVDAALTTDPDNDDLVKLKNDLEEVINLTGDLVQSQMVGARQQSSGATSGGGGRGLSYGGKVEDDVDDGMEVRSWLNRVDDWKTGDKCRAPWTDTTGEQQYYPATIDEIMDDGSCSVQFDKYGTMQVIKLSLLLPAAAISRTADSDEEGEEDQTEGGTGADPRKQKTKKDLSLAQREYKKKKAQKKAQRLKQHEDEREQDKNKWLSFNTKVLSKTTKGKVKKSIFASPDCLTTGKVGVGTCGVSGRPMTKFTHMEKWKK